MRTSSTPSPSHPDGARRDGTPEDDGLARSAASSGHLSERASLDERLPDLPNRQQPESDQRYLELAERIAFWMDRRYVDPILGFLVPGAGDAIGAGIGLLGVFAAFRMRAHPVVIARMLINLAVDSLFGSIPVVGAVIDFFYKAHTRNLDLLRQRDVRVPKASDWLTVAGAALLFVGALLLPLVVVALIAAWLLG